jgi:hypothetical protein
MNAPDPFVVRRKQRNPAVEDCYLDCVVGQDQFEVIVLHRIAGLLVSVNATEVKQVLGIDRSAHIRRNLAPAPYLYGKTVGLHALFEHAPAVLNLFQVLNHVVRVLFLPHRCYPRLDSSSLILLFNMYASCQAKIFEYLFKIRFEALRELAFNGHRELDPDF